MATLVPGTLLKLLQHMNTDVKVSGEHRTSVLQIVGIVPALAGGELFPNRGFHLKVSDSTHATYASLPDEQVDLILSDKLQLGQFIHVQRFEASSPVPILRGVKPIPGRHACVGSPEDLVATHTLHFVNPSGANLIHKTSPGSSNDDSLHKKEKSKISSKNGSRAGEMEKRIANFCRSQSVSLKQSSTEAKQVSRRLNPTSTSLAPSSPRSCYSLPTSFEKFANGIKNQSKIKTNLQRDGPKVGPASSSSKVVSGRLSGKKAGVKNSVGDIVVEVGTSVLRKSWDENVKLVKHDALNRKGVQANVKPEVRSSSVPRMKPEDSDKMPSKDTNRVQTPLRKMSTSQARNKAQSPMRKGTGETTDDSEKVNTKKSAVAKKDSGDVLNGLLSNLVKVPLGVKKLTDDSISWTSLPSSLAKIGKEVIKHRDAARAAAIEAIQEASAAESLIRCLSVYVEMSLSASEDNPQPAVEQFLGLYANMKNASAVADSLVSSTTSSTENQENLLSEEALQICMERQRSANSWVQAALTTNLSSFTVFTKHLVPGFMIGADNRSVVLLDGTSKNVASKAQPKAQIVSNSKLSGSLHHASNGPSISSKSCTSSQVEWTCGSGLSEAASLAKSLQVECRDWFLRFLEKFLDADGSSLILKDHGQIAGMLSQLKRVNDWLDEIDDCKDDDSCNVPTGRVGRLRKKIYDYLLTHVESAAVALNGRPFAPG